MPAAPWIELRHYVTRSRDEYMAKVRRYAGRTDVGTDERYHMDVRSEASQMANWRYLTVRRGCRLPAGRRLR